MPVAYQSRAVTEPQRDAGTASAVTEGSPDFGLLPMDKRQGNVQKTTVIAPKGTRRLFNESWYAAVARSAATWQFVPPNVEISEHFR